MRKIIEDKIESLKNSNTRLTFSELIADIAKNKKVELYMGDEYETVVTDQVSEPYPAVFFGTVIGAHNECLILDSSESKYRLPFKGILFIQERGIKAAVISEDNEGMLENLFLRSKDC